LRARMTDDLFTGGGPIDSPSNRRRLRGSISNERRHSLRLPPRAIHSKHSERYGCALGRSKDVMDGVRKLPIPSPSTVNIDKSLPISKSKSLATRSTPNAAGNVTQNTAVELSLCRSTHSLATRTPTAKILSSPKYGSSQSSPKTPASRHEIRHSPMRASVIALWPCTF